MRFIRIAPALYGLERGTRASVASPDGRFTNYTMAGHDGLPNELVTAVFEDREGRFWAGTHGGLAVFDNGSKLP